MGEVFAEFANFGDEPDVAYQLASGRKRLLQYGVLVDEQARLPVQFLKGDEAIFVLASSPPHCITSSRLFIADSCSLHST
jgi:hypothetical protein